MLYPADVAAQTPHAVSFERIFGFPSHEEGIAKGVSACFAGAIGDSLVMAGGCNFPDTPAAEGGQKRYYKGIYAAKVTERKALDWQLVGELPEPCAYGVTIQLPDALLLIGGNNHDGSSAKVLKLGLKAGKALLETWPSLPTPMDNFTGSTDDNRVLVYNGEHLFALDLQAPGKGWSELSLAHPAKIGQPVSGFSGGIFHVWGGATAKTAHEEATLRIEGTRFCEDKERFQEGKEHFQESKKRFCEGGETPVPTPKDGAGEEIFLGGGAAINLSDRHILAIGGVNKDVFLSAVNHPQPGYMTHEVEWYRFNPVVSVYDGHRWHCLGTSKITARAGAALVKFRDKVYIIGGELKPGIRTPDIYRMEIGME